jgi:capsular polysaccharide biosynthesis protein
VQIENDGVAMSGQATNLFHDYQQTGRLDLLNAAIESFRDLVATIPPDHCDRPMYLFSLGVALRSRFERTGQLVDLDQAITAGRDAVNTAPPDHPDRAVYLSNLGLVLQTRFERADQQADLGDAVAAAGDAVSTTAPDRSKRHAYSVNLRLALRQLEGTLEVLLQWVGGWIERLTEDRGGGRLTVRFALLVLAITLLGTAGGLAGALVLPKTYGARAEILYPISRGQGGDPLRQDRQLSTQLVFLKSRAVLGPVTQKHGRQFEELDKDVSVKVLENSEVIQVEAHGSTELAAMQTLQAVMDGYLALAGQLSGAARDLEIQLAGGRQNSAQLQTWVQELTTAVLAGTATQTSLNEARAQLAASLDREKVIQARIDEVKLTGQVGPNTQLLTPPYSLPDPVSPQPLVAAGTGALVGLLVAGGVVVVVVVGARRRTKW